MSKRARRGLPDPTLGSARRTEAPGQPEPLPRRSGLASCPAAQGWGEEVSPCSFWSPPLFYACFSLFTLPSTRLGEGCLKQRQEARVGGRVAGGYFLVNFSFLLPSPRGTPRRPGLFTYRNPSPPLPSPGVPRGSANSEAEGGRKAEE